MELRVIERMNRGLIRYIFDFEIKKVVKVIKSDSFSGVDDMID